MSKFVVPECLYIVKVDIYRLVWPTQSPLHFSAPRNFYSFTIASRLIHRDSRAQVLHCGHDLFRIILGHILLHHLWRAIDKLFALHQAQP